MKKLNNFPSYSISKNGNILNIKTGRVLKQNTNQKGYYQVQLSNNGFSKTITIHKLVYENFIGKILKGFEINHIDGNKSNNCVSNLELVTRKQNMIKAVELGLIKSGIDNERSVQVYQIDPVSKKVLNEFGSINIAQKKTGVSSSSISLATRGIRNSAGGFLWEIK